MTPADTVGDYLFRCGGVIQSSMMMLSRELSCALVEGGDLTVRGGAVFLKTLKGLQPVDVLLRRMDSQMLDPLELDAGSLIGVPGLMDAARSGTVRISNDPGAGAVEAPALAAWLPALAMRLLGEPLKIASVRVPLPRTSVSASASGRLPKSMRAIASLRSAVRSRCWRMS